MRNLTGYKNILEADNNSTADFLLRRNYVQPCAYLVVLILIFCLSFPVNAQRRDISLNDNWQTSLNNTNNWKQVNIPHNWDDYYGYRRLVHGNLHGYALYKKTFAIHQTLKGKRFFLFFEGVGSYATIWLNKKQVGYHAGGRTTFTIDITAAIKTDGSLNLLEVKASEPAYIKDLPWVCGGCSDERGFSEGSQPLGIFRPVHLVVTNDIKVQPFGVHVWADIRNEKAALHSTITLKNYSGRQRTISIVHQLIDEKGSVVESTSMKQLMRTQDSTEFLFPVMVVDNPHLWSLEDPYTYNIVTLVKENNVVLDKTETTFGFRTIEWHTPSHQFLLNGKPVFINGVAEYEHLLGQSHAFSKEQVEERIKWVQLAGFNAFRDAHQPHNLLYGNVCDSIGILWWTQFSAHIWFDTPAFRNNFKQLLKDWVIERRNDPALILWGLQNESKLPEDFAKECTEIIRSLDPTASSQRLVTTCNGGEGTDWDVPQNWSGTYGGDPDKYADELKKEILVGEYGAWRTIDLHTEGGFVQNSVYSEDRMTLLMEKKIRLAESVKDSVAGQFFWLLSSHDNPGRVQAGEGLRDLDRVGPVNYKGLLTVWDEPTDAFYMFRSNYVSKEKEPMVYIVSHTWPGRWMIPGFKDGIVVYSNCDEVELFNDVNGVSLGRKRRNEIGTHFQWDHVNIQYNVLYAVGYVKGQPVARDTIVLNHLPPSPHFNQLYNYAVNVNLPQKRYEYVYRVNCGGGLYTDENGNTWVPDEKYFHSWAEDFKNIPKDFASQRRTFSPIKNSKDWKLFQSFRYGKDKLKFAFPVPDGEYIVELYFIEPWLGIGGGFDAAGMRLFDVAVNDKIVLKNFDIWKEAGTNTVIKKIVTARVSGGKMIISFPHSKAGQALISAIAIARKNNNPPKKVSPINHNPYSIQSWLDIGDKVFSDQQTEFNSLPPNLFGADWILPDVKTHSGDFNYRFKVNSDLFVAIKKDLPRPSDLKGYENTKTQIVTDEDGGTVYDVYRRRFGKNESVSLKLDSNKIVCFKPVDNMEPAYDLKPVAAFHADAAVTGDGVEKSNHNGRLCAVVKTNKTCNVQWPVQTGVADRYSITVKYYFSGKAVDGHLQLLDAGGHIMVDKPVRFNFTREEKWNQFTLTTDDMINAGNYMVKLIVTNAKGLAFSGIEIQ